MDRIKYLLNHSNRTDLARFCLGIFASYNENNDKNRLFITSAELVEALSRVVEDLDLELSDGKMQRSQECIKQLCQVKQERISFRDFVTMTRQLLKSLLNPSASDRMLELDTSSDYGADSDDETQDELKEILMDLLGELGEAGGKLDDSLLLVDLNYELITKVLEEVFGGLQISEEVRKSNYPYYAEELKMAIFNILLFITVNDVAINDKAIGSVSRDLTNYIDLFELTDQTQARCLMGAYLQITFNTVDNYNDGKLDTQYGSAQETVCRLDWLTYVSQMVFHMMVDSADEVVDESNGDDEDLEKLYGLVPEEEHVIGLETEQFKEQLNEVFVSINFGESENPLSEILEQMTFDDVIVFDELDILVVELHERIMEHYKSKE